MPTSLKTRRYLVTGSQRSSNFLWASFVSLGGIAFLYAGFVSFLEKDISSLELAPPKTIAFFPQGLIMCFYGSLGLLFAVYVWCTIFWSVGNGFNEFNKDSGEIRIFRWGLPGRERRIDLKYKIKDIETLRVQLKEGVNPRRSILLQVKGKGEIPLTRIGQPIGLQDIESEASELAQFLQVSLQTVYKT